MARRTPEDIKRDKLADIYEKQVNEDAKRKDMSKTQAEREAAERKYQALLTQELNILDQIAKLREREANSLDSITRKLNDQIKALEEKDDLTEDQNKLLDEATKLHSKITEGIKDGTLNVKESVDKYHDLNDEIKKAEKIARKLEESSQQFLSDVTGALTKVPLIGGALSSGLKTFLSTKKGQELSKNIAKKLFNPKTMGKSLKGAISLGLGTAGVALIGTGVSLATKQSEVMKDIRRSLGLTNDEAEKFRDMSKGMLSDSNSMATSQKEILEAASQLSNTYGTIVQDNEKLVNSQITLTKGFGLQAEDAEKINMLADATGQDYEKQLQATVATAQATGKVYKYSFNTNKVLADVAKLSASIQASFKGSTASMAKAVIQTKLMGTTLGQLDSVADNLLQIESSIENQVTAQLVTSKNINLDKARMLALNNDLVGVGQELVNQGIDYATFSKMNRVEMQSTAAAMGMQKDELADMLLKQEVYKRAGADIRATDAATLKLNEDLIKAKAEAGDAEAKKYIDSQKQLSLQERMTAAMEKFSAVLETAYKIIIGIGIALATAAAIMTFGASIPFLAGLTGIAEASTVGVGVGILGGVASGHLPGMATGGKVVGGRGPVVVGEHGPEVVNLKRGDTVTSNSQLNKINSNKETNDLLRQLVANVQQPAIIKLGNTTINELDNKLSLNRDYRAGVGNTYNRLG